jgi:hypothetical protein
MTLKVAIDCLRSELCLQGLEKLRTIQIVIADITAKIRTKYLGIMSLQGCS